MRLFVCLTLFVGSMVYASADDERSFTVVVKRLVLPSKANNGPHNPVHFSFAGDSQGVTRAGKSHSTNRGVPLDPSDCAIMLSGKNGIYNVFRKRDTARSLVFQLWGRNEGEFEQKEVEIGELPGHIEADRVAIYITMLHDGVFQAACEKVASSTSHHRTSDPSNVVVVHSPPESLTSSSSSSSGSSLPIQMSHRHSDPHVTWSGRGGGGYGQTQTHHGSLPGALGPPPSSLAPQLPAHFSTFASAPPDK